MQDTGALAKYISEFIGTFFLVFTIGCCVHTGTIGAGIAIGMMLMVMIYALGSVSGAHFNPAVTLSILLAGRGKIQPNEAAMYMVFQVAGGVLAALLYWKLTSQAFLLAPVGVHMVRDAVCVEIMYTMALCYVVLNVATTEGPKGNCSNGPNNFFGLAIGSVVMCAAIAIGPVSGCSLNPAVSLGSIVAAYFAHGAVALHYWVPYVASPFVGAGFAALFFYLVRTKYEYGREEIATKPKAVDVPRMAQAPPKPKPPASPPRANVARAGSRVLRRHDSVALTQLDPECINHDLFCGLRWLTSEDTLDVDASCVKFSQQGACLGAVYFACQEDKANNIKHHGDAVVGDIAESKAVRKSVHDNEKISFKLADISPSVHFLFFVANIFSSGAHSFKDVRECSIRLVNSTAGDRELLNFEKKDIGTGNALVIAMLSRSGDTWLFKAIDESYQIQEHGTYRALEPQLQRFCLQMQETMSMDTLRAEGP